MFLFPTSFHECTAACLRVSGLKDSTRDYICQPSLLIPHACLSGPKDWFSPIGFEQNNFVKIWGTGLIYMEAHIPSPSSLSSFVDAKRKKEMLGGEEGITG